MENINKAITQNIHKKIKLDTQLDVIKLTQITSKYREKIECVETNRLINAKSILGILSMDLSKPITIVFYNTNEQAEILKEINEWVV